MSACYKCVALNVNLDPLLDGCIPHAKLYWRGRAIAWAVPIRSPSDRFILAKLASREWRGRMTLQGVQGLPIGSILCSIEMEALLGMLSNREYAISRPWEKLGTIRNKVDQPYKFQLESGQMVWKDGVFCTLKKVIPMEARMIEDSVCQDLLEPAQGPYRNDHCSVPKKNGKYTIINLALSVNRHSLEATEIQHHLEQYSETFEWLPISSLIDFQSGYNQELLHKDGWDNMTSQSVQGMHLPTWLVHGATNSVSAFVRVSQKLLHAYVGSMAEIFVDDLTVKGARGGDGEE